MGRAILIYDWVLDNGENEGVLDFVFPLLFCCPDFCLYGSDITPSQSDLCCSQVCLTWQSSNRFRGNIQAGATLSAFPSSVFVVVISLDLVVFVWLLVIAEVFLFPSGRFVAVVSLETLFVFLLYCCLTIAGRLFVLLLLARFSLDLTLFSWRFY